MVQVALCKNGKHCTLCPRHTYAYVSCSGAAQKEFSADRFPAQRSLEGVQGSLIRVQVDRNRASRTHSCVQLGLMTHGVSMSGHQRFSMGGKGVTHAIDASQASASSTAQLPRPPVAPPTATICAHAPAKLTTSTACRMLNDATDRAAHGCAEVLNVP
jgi:hypothetical protein